MFKIKIRRTNNSVQTLGCICLSEAYYKFTCLENWPTFESTALNSETLPGNGPQDSRMGYGKSLWTVLRSQSWKETTPEMQVKPTSQPIRQRSLVQGWICSSVD